MKVKFNIIIISAIALVMLVIGLIFAINNRKESIKYFYDGGYVINNVYDDQKNEVDKIYFETNTAYTKHSNDEYSFNDSDGRKKVLDDDTFIHYNDNSIMALKDGVAIDLNNIDSRLITYYNIFSESVFTKTTKGYEINNLNETLNFGKLLFKISDKKYLLAADEIVISFSDSQTVSLKNYVEIEYVKENVIKLYNDEANYQTISSNLYLIVDNIKINLEYKTISKNNIKYLTMADMVINSNDNIEVLPTEPIEQNSTENSNQDNNNNQNATSNNQNTNNGNQGGTESDEEISEQLNNLVTPNENVDNSDDFIQPKFTVDSMEVTSLGFENLKINVEDESNVLYGNKQVELVENSTGNVIDTFEEWDEGSLKYSINYYTKLKPNKEYTLNIKGQYKIEDTVYDRTFVSKIFRTLDVGLEITEDFVTSNTVSFAIYRNNYSKVNGISYEIVDSDDNVIIEETELKFENDKNVVIATSNDDLKANSNYKILIKKIQYDSDVYSTTDTPNLFVSYKLKTLKQKPNIDSLNLVGKLDNQANSIKFSIENLIDNNNGIKSITYNIYNSSGDETAEPIYSLTQDEYKEFNVNVEDLGQGESYYFTAVIEFDDNQKTVVYTTSNSNAIVTSPIKYPQVVRFEKGDDSGADLIDGVIEILDEENYIGINGIKKYNVILKENSGSQTEIIPYTSTLSIEGGSLAQGKVTLPVKFEGLKSNTEYVMYVYLESTSTKTYIGYEKTKTDAPESLYLVATNLTSDDISNELFAFNLKIGENSKSINNLNYLKMNLSKCNASAVCEVLNSFTRTLPQTQNQAFELETLKNKENVTIASSEFNFYISNYDLESDEYYKVSLTAISNNNYVIPIKIYEHDIDGTKGEYKDKSEFKVDIIDNAPSVDVKITEVPKSNCENMSECKNNTDYTDLDDDTIVGFNLDIKPIKSTKGMLIKNFSYEIYKSDTCDSDSVKEKTSIKGNEFTKITGDNMVDFINMSNLDRGTHYCLKYVSKYDDDKGNEKEIEGYKDLFALKQSAEISGYISKYDGSNITFKITNKDPDGAVKKFNLIANNNVYESIKIDKQNGEYTFKVDNLRDFKLLVHENKGTIEDVAYTIYEDNLDNVKTGYDFDLIVRTGSNGMLYFDLPFSSEYCTINDINSCEINENISDLNIYGIKITYQNEQKETINKFIQFRKQDSYYSVGVTPINFENFGIINNTDKKEITIPHVSVIYDSDTIDVDNSEYFFIKNPFETNNQKYYSIKEGKFINMNDSSDTLYKKMTKEQQYISVSTSNTIQLNLTKYKSDNPNTPYIGQRYEDNLIHLNKAFSASDTDEKVTMLDINHDKIDYNEGYKIPYEDAIYLSDFKKVYKTDGAKLKFNLDLEKYKDVKGLNFKLYTKNEDNTYNEIYSSTSNINEEKIDRIDKTISSNEGVAIYKNDKDEPFTIDLNLDSTKTYYYTINCLKDGNKLYDTYDETGRKYSMTEINTIKKLYITNKSTSYNKNYWDFDSTKKLSFEKILNYSFAVNTDNYELNTNEEVRYKIYLRNEDNNDYLLKNSIDDTDYYKLNSSIKNSISTNSGNVNIITKISDSEKLEGKYLVVVKPYIFNKEKNIEVDLEEVNLNTNQKRIEITNNEPKISVGIKNSTDVNIMVKDEDGVLIPCQDEISTKSNLKKYLPESVYDPGDYVYHFSISQFVDQKTIGYTPIGLNNISLTLNLKDFFRDYPSAKYVFNIKYCSINGDKSVDFTYNVYNPTLLNLALGHTIESNKYILYMTNPETVEKERIKIIEYTVLYSDNTTLTKTFNNINVSLDDNIKYDHLKPPDTDIDIYVVQLPYKEKESFAKSITVSLKDKDGNIITQVSS